MYLFLIPSLIYSYSVVSFTCDLRCQLKTWCTAPSVVFTSTCTRHFEFEYVTYSYAKMFFSLTKPKAINTVTNIEI